MVTLKVKDYGSIRLTLDWQSAPNTCANFVALAREGFYDGLTFHRIIKNFMIQGGDPRGDGTGGPAYAIKGEFKLNGVGNAHAHKRGAISMARAQDPDSAGSQFFICDRNDNFLDGNYAAFGDVADEESLKVVDKIASVKTFPQNDQPLANIVIENVEVSSDEPQVTVEKIAG